MRRLLVVAVLAVLAVASLSACGNNRKCLRSHIEVMTTYTLVGKVLVPIVTSHDVCDEYAQVS